MPNPLLLSAGTSIAGGLFGGRSQSRAASEASAAQLEGTKLGIEEQRRQFNLMRRLSQPYVAAGGQGLQGALALMGLSGNQKQQQAINKITNGAEFGSMVRAGESAILGNASATGGLRGGNTEAALAQFRPEILSNLINKQIGNFGGLASNGQNAAVGVGTAGMNMGNNVSQLIGDGAAATAGGALARGQASANMWGGIAGTVGNVLGNIQPPAGATTFGSWGF